MHPQRKNLFGAVVVIVLFLMVIVGRELVIKLAKEGDQRELYAYILTMDKINKLAEVRKSVGEWLDSNKQTLEAMEDDKALAEGTFTQRARGFDSKYPEVAAVIRKQGMSTREYLLGSDVLFRAFKLAAAKQQGDLDYYSKAESGFNPANVTFVEQHFEEVRQSMQEGLRIRM